MPGNVPDDYRLGFKRCPDCGQSYHLSGEYECACPITDCDECGGMGHTIGFLGRKKIKYPCESCEGGE